MSFLFIRTNLKHAINYKAKVGHTSSTLITKEMIFKDLTVKWIENILINLMKLNFITKKCWKWVFLHPNLEKQLMLTLYDLNRKNLTYVMYVLLIYINNI